MRAFLALITLLLLSAGPALALESAPVRSPRATVTLVSEAAAIAPGQPFRLALRQKMAPGWHTYWRNPGDAGQPPELRLELPEGWTAGELQFPAPHRIPFGPLVNFGYEDEAIFLMEVRPPANLVPGQTQRIEASADWLICERVCIPEEGRFTLDIPVEANARPSAPLLFAAAEAALPRAAAFTARIGFEGMRGAISLEGPGLSPGALREAFFFPLEQMVVENATPQPLTAREGGFTLGLTRASGPMPATAEGVVAITDAAGVRGAYWVSAVPGPMPGTGAALALWQALVFAALGGLILNLMPCVFPILAMKAIAVARLAGAERSVVRAHAAAYTAGVVLSFLAIGGAMLGLRAAGSLAGWGFQFTSPFFVAGMAWLMLAVGLNLSGVYAIGGPVGVGSGLAAKGGRAGSFFAGVLAVLVATPCTAPFMAAAIGAALAMPPLETLAIFGAMGLGLALPYALLGVFPSFARVLPRPGAWMDRLKQFLAFPMYLAAAWLVWVVAQQAGPDGTLLVLVGGVLLGMAAWALGLAQQGSARRWFIGGAALSLIAALALLPLLKSGTAGGAAASAQLGEPWSAPRLDALREEGRPVFVNLTAAWCISCKVNERVALDTAAVRAAFAAGDVTVLTGDWTNGDPAITALLRAQGRDGVPLYLLYPAGGGAPAILPQILTEGIMLRAIAAATSRV
ncbi:protein-disulfide reductase DsbD family protein [Roseococcus sp.]|uniref:protein-disulfide reductase DsbD family protein n=1 Tax=Roseococcus sp. TaxID=2109646 RepID=UPI003BABD4E7